MIYLLSYLAVGVLMAIYHFEGIKSFQFTASVEGFKDLSLPSRLFCAILVFPSAFISYGAITAAVYIDRFIKRIVK